MKTRKILALLMAVLMLVGCMAACGGDTTTPDNGDQTDAPDGGSTVVADSWTDEQIASMGESIAAEANGQAITLKLWGPEAAQEVLKEQANKFIDIFKDYADIKIDVVVQGENEAAGAVLNDPKTAADVFGFPSDQLDKL